MDIASTLGDFVPVDGDIIKSMYGTSRYYRGRWTGGVTHMIPGRGYKYYSNRTEIVSFVFNKTNQLAVTTSEPTDITAISAVVGGTVTLPEGGHVFLRGVCWGTEPSPDIDGNHTSDGTGIGMFSSTLDSLIPNTTYYIRAYVVSDDGLSYGDEMNFTTELISGYIITTFANPSEGGIVTGGGSYEEDATCTLIATPNEGYIFTNWTENDEVVSNDAEYSFTVTSNRSLVANFTVQSGVPTGAINGLFTINAEGAQVRFSQGNLQYQASTNTWRFAESQWDYVGEDNSNISSEYDGWIDLFGWGTSGYHNIYDNFNVNYQPYSTSTATVNTECNYYGYGPSTNMSDPNLTGLNAGYDWGVHNAISNGGNQVGLWHTLSGVEWEYVFFTRPASTVGNTSNARFAKATVNGIQGVILFPDVFSVPIYLPTPLQINSVDASFGVNSYSGEGWNELENLGCVFLPKAGSRSNYAGQTYHNWCTYVYPDTGSYWSSSYYSSSQSYYVFFNDGSLYPRCVQSNVNRFLGFSVRLVRDAE